jgi:hypothetical protein
MSRRSWEHRPTAGVLEPPQVTPMCLPEASRWHSWRPGIEQRLSRLEVSKACWSSRGRRTNGGPTLARLSSSLRRPVENWLRAMHRNSQSRPSSSQNTHGLAFLGGRLILTGQQSRFDQQGGDHGSTEEATSGTKTKRKVGNAPDGPQAPQVSAEKTGEAEDSEGSPKETPGQG